MFRSLLVLICCANIFAENIDSLAIDLSQFGTEIFGIPVQHNLRNAERKYGNPEERGHYLEGDLLIPVNSKNGIKPESYRWSNGIIPYEIRGSFSKNSIQKCFEHNILK